MSAAGCMATMLVKGECSRNANEKHIFLSTLLQHSVRWIIGCGLQC